MMTIFSRIGFGCAIATVVLLCTSCTGGGEEGGLDRDEVYSAPQSPPSPEPQSSSVRVEVPPNPFAEFALTDEQEAIVKQAQDQLIGDCMAAAGFEYRPGPLQQQNFDGYLLVFDEVWGPMNPELTEQYGYSRPRNISLDDDGRAVDNTPEFVEATEDRRAYTDALAGTGPDDPGCAGSAITVVNANTTVLSLADQQEYGRIQQAAESAARSDDRVVALIADWSACMAGQGYDYADPSEPLTGTWEGAAEKDTANADVECKHSVGLVQGWVDVLREHQRRVIDENRSFLQTWLDWNLGRLTGAQAILAGGS